MDNASTSNELKTFEELYKLYEKVKSNIVDTCDNGKEVPKSDLEPLLTYVDEMLQATEKSDESYVQLVAMKSALLYEQSKMMSVSLDLARKALDLLEEYKANPRVTYLYYRVLNFLAYYLTKEEQFDEARTLLENAEVFYNSMSSTDLFIYTIDEQFLNKNLQKSNNNYKFERLITNNLQLLAWIYNKIDLVDKFIVYHHMVLRRQLEMQDGNAFTWVFKCARLAAYFFSKMKFSEARHHLAAAYAILHEFEMDLLKQRTKANFSSEWQNFQHYVADLGKYWIKYGLCLFEVSRKQIISPEKTLDNLLITSFDDNSEDKTNLLEPEKQKQLVEGTEEEYKFVFPSLQFQLQDTESFVTASLIQTTEQARALFSYIQQWLKRTKSYYTVRDFPVDYVDLVLDLNELYKFLAAYETDLDEQYDVQKRRADVLDTLCSILKEVSPYYYLPICVELLRELTQVQIELVQINMKRIAAFEYQGEVAIQNAARKLDALTRIRSRLSDP